MKKPAKYVTTPVRVCKNPVKTLQKPCFYILFTHFLHTFYIVYRLVTYFTYFLIKEQRILVSLFHQRLINYNIVKLLHIGLFTQALKKKLLVLILISLGFFPLQCFGGVF